jgi:hypothetical protein
LLGAEALVYGDLCLATKHYRNDRRVYCLQEPVNMALDADGSEKPMCADCVSRYFPNHVHTVNQLAA